MNIGLIDVDGRNFPNFALMKIAAYHRAKGDTVSWAKPLFPDYDRVYMSKIFNFTPDVFDVYNCEVVRGGTGYDYRSRLPEVIEGMQPDYSIYPFVDARTAYGFITRGCPNKCSWCIVPKKEGGLVPYRDVDTISEGGRRPNLILMDNNILASDFGLEQIKRIVDRKYHVDFNQALDARLVTDDIAQLLARVKWLRYIRLGCDTSRQVAECDRAMQLIDKYRGRHAYYLLYTMISDDIEESYERISHFRHDSHTVCVAQPFRDPFNAHHAVPQWQFDLARWAMRREFFKAVDFKDFEVRKGFKCGIYFKKEV
jgi:hypothetical protein